MFTADGKELTGPPEGEAGRPRLGRPSPQQYDYEADTSYKEWEAEILGDMRYVKLGDSDKRFRYVDLNVKKDGLHVDLLNRTLIDQYMCYFCVQIHSDQLGLIVREKRAERPRKSGGTSEADVQVDGSSIYRLEY